MRNVRFFVMLFALSSCIASAQDGSSIPQSVDRKIAASKTTADSKGGAVYFSKEQVDQVFAKGGVLYKAPEMKFQIHAARKSEAGQAEIHARDTDIFYILEGSATLITGGTLVGLKNTSPDEVRGESITGGESRQLSKGDVVIIPNGTPHLLKEIQGTLLYYVVKTRT